MGGAVLLLAVLAGLAVLEVGAHEATIQHRLQREGVRVRGLLVRHRVHSSAVGPTATQTAPATGHGPGATFTGLPVLRSEAATRHGFD